MDLLCNGFFTTTAFTIDDHAVIGWSNKVDLLKNIFKIRTVAEDIGLLPIVFSFGVTGFGMTILFYRICSDLFRCIKCLTYREQDLLRKQRLGYVVDRP
jgi:hypothetical protein